VLYAFLGGSLMIIFWRGIWHTTDMLEAKEGILSFIFYPPITLVWSGLLMLFIGVFIPLFIGEQIILSGLKQEKTFNEKTKKEIDEEEVSLDRVNERIIGLERQIEELKSLILEKN
jgi:hypothetical protein